MAVYDREQHKVVVRVVYDGAAHSGKTTNLHQICASFTQRRRGELIVPAESDGRTLFFDWLQLDSGLVGGFPLRCQLVSAPGQPSLRDRRAHLLASTDVVVFVCDASSAGIEDARHSYAELCELLGEDADVPIVVQANKQDLPGAADEATLRSALNLSDDTPVAPATAATGVGIRETLVLAIRAAANQVQRKLIAHGVDALDGVSEDAEELYEAMLAAEAARRAAVDSIDDAWSDDLGGDDDEGPWEPVDGDPDLPNPMVPSGFIWPGTTGRAILHDLGQSRPRRRDDLVGRQGMDEGSGRSDIVIYEVGPWFLKTSARRCYVDVDTARAALLELARKKVRLGSLLLPRTVLSLRPATDGAVWLWTVAPLVTTLRGEMASADRDDEEDRLGASLARFATATVDSLLLAREHGLLLDIHPGNFAEVDGQIVYLDDDIEQGDTVPLIGHLMLQRVLEYEHRPAATRRYVDALEREIRDRLSWSDVSELDLPDALRSTPVRSPGVREARERLARAADRVLARP